jgi:hypothetical protein
MEYEKKWRNNIYYILYKMVRKSIKRKSIKRKSIKQKSIKQKSIKQKSIKQKSIKQKSIKKVDKIKKIKKSYRFGGDEMTKKEDKLMTKEEVELMTKKEVELLLKELLMKEMISFFPEIDPSNISIRVIRHNTAADIQIVNCKETLVHYGGYFPAVEIDFESKMMSIDLLIGCHPITGREMLSRLISLAKKLNFSHVILEDQSELYVHPSVYGRKECFLSLAPLRILQKGESWYQSLGFMSEQDAEDRVHNERIRAMSLREFAEAVAKRDKRSSGEALLASLLEAFPNLDGDMRVSDSIQKMLTALNEIGETVCEHRAFYLLSRLIDGSMLIPLIHYQSKNRVLDLSPSSPN